MFCLLSRLPLEQLALRQHSLVSRTMSKSLTGKSKSSNWTLVGLSGWELPTSVAEPVGCKEFVPVPTNSRNTHLRTNQ